MNSIKSHWEKWSRQYGTSLRATTKSSISKQLEIDALLRRLTELGFTTETNFSALEVGCGNGHNCFAVAQRFPAATIYGCDFIDEMISNANKSLATDYAGLNIHFSTADVLAAESFAHIPGTFDIIFTNRCLINLQTTENQCAAISTLAGKLDTEGCLILIENTTATHGKQNHCRELLGMQPRPVAEFNYFFREDEILAHCARTGLTLLEKEDFSSLHDLLLYVLIPSVNGGKVEYDHPLVEAAAQLSMRYATGHKSSFGEFGQNRMYVFKKQ